MEKLELYGSIDDKGALSIHNRQRLLEWAMQHPGKNVVIKFERKGSKRSLPQNNYYHGVVVQTVRLGLKEIGYSLSHEEAHFFLKQKFNPIEIPNKDGEAIEVPGSTTQLNKIEFGEFVERIAQWAAEYLSVVIPAPTESLKFKF
jgi:hypothetical protein